MLVDNGSIRAEAVCFLRSIAADLSDRSGVPVFPVSYNHSHRVDPERLGGEPAMVLANAARDAYREGCRRIGILPFFLSGGGGILKMVEREATLIASALPGLEFYRTGFLIEGWGTTDSRMAVAVRDRIVEQVDGIGSDTVDVVVVDHGSPYPEAATLRNFIGGQVSVLLEKDQRIRRLVVASMERRPGAFYAFNEPLLSVVLKTLGSIRPVVLGQLFLGPGKHAGADGDIASIAASILGNNGWVQTRPLGDHPRIRELLLERLRGPLKGFRLRACSLEDRERCPCLKRAR